MNWQPIETAPKTRTSILVWCDGNKCAYVVSWCDWITVPTWTIFGSHRSRLTFPPTHWMPVPKGPPEADDDQDQDDTAIYEETGGEG